MATLFDFLIAGQRRKDQEKLQEQEFQQNKELAKYKNQLAVEEEDRKFRDVAKNIYLDNTARGLPQRTSEDELIGLKTSGPRALSAENQENAERARIGIFNLPGEAEATRTFNASNTANNILNRDATLRKSAPGIADAFNAQQGKIQSEALLDTDVNNALRFGGSAVNQAVTGADAGTSANMLANRRATAQIPGVEDEEQTRQIDTKNRMLRGLATTPADIANEAEVARQQNITQLQLQKLEQMFPGVSKAFNALRVSGPYGNVSETLPWNPGASYQDIINGRGMAPPPTGLPQIGNGATAPIMTPGAPGLPIPRKGIPIPLGNINDPSYRR